MGIDVHVGFALITPGGELLRIMHLAMRLPNTCVLMRCAEVMITMAIDGCVHMFNTLRC